MDPLATWEKILLGVLALLVILWFFPGVKTLVKESRDVERDWPAVLFPLLAVVAFVALLISIV
tara:strand:- start:72 stop:260 length:189 start_codon:yes stop_codon:yes gene_type:complete